MSKTRYSLQLVAAILAVLMFGAKSAEDTCSALVYPGPDDVDIKIAAIYGLHASSQVSCDTRFQAWSLQTALALHWAASLINGDNGTDSFIPGVKIGIDLYDDYNNNYLTALHAGHVTSQGRCAYLEQCSYNGGQQNSPKPIAGIIGTTRSQTTSLVTDIAISRNIPVVGISATLAELSDKKKYPGFYRTVPSDRLQAEVIIKLALKFNWSYVVGIFTTDNYGKMGMDHLRVLAAEYRICISAVTSLDNFNDLDEATLRIFFRDTLFSKVKASKGNIGVIYFGQNESLRRLLNLFNDWSSNWLDALYNFERIHWLVSDGVILDTVLASSIDKYGTHLVKLDPPMMEMPSFREFQQGFFESPPEWAKVEPWRGALEWLAKNEYGCQSYNFTSDSATGCDLGGPVTYSGYLAAPIDALYLLVNTLRVMHSELCPATSGMCQELQKAIEEGILTTHSLTEIDYTSLDPGQVPREFFQKGRALVTNGSDFLVQNQALYSIWVNEGRQFVEIGNYTGDKVQLLPQYERILPQAACLNVCSECHDLAAVRYRFVDGDYIILGIFSLHWKNQHEVFECGESRGDSSSFPAMVAFLNAIERLKATTGINFGYFIIDDCYNSLTISRMLSKTMSGDLEVICKYADVVLDPKKVVVGVGAQSSPVTIAALPIMQGLGLPLISYSSTNADLDSRISYPYFTRTVMSDARQAYAISMILQDLNVTYVGAVVFGNAYGRALYKRFREIAESQGICVSESFEVTEATTVSQLKPILHKYRSSDIKVIVAFVMDKAAGTLLDAVDRDDTFVFVGSEAWSRNQDLLAGSRGERARGSLILEPMGFDVDYEFKKYMGSLHQSETESDVWFRDFWENYFDCNLPRGFNNNHKTSCNKSQSHFSSDALQQFDNSPLVIHTSVATMAAGLAVKSMVDDISKSPYDFLPFDPDLLSKNIREVMLRSSKGVPFRPFLPSGNGNGSLKVYNVQHIGNNMYDYIEVGTFRDRLTMDSSLLKFYDITGQPDKVVSSCLFRDECNQICRPQQPLTTATPKDKTAKLASTEDDDDVLVIILGVIIAALFLFIVIIIILVILTCTGVLSWSRITNIYCTSSGMTNYSKTSRGTRCHGDGSLASSSCGISGENRPPLPPLGKRKNTISSEMGANNVLGSSQKSLSDIVLYPDGSRNSDSNTSRLRSQSMTKGLEATDLDVTAGGVGASGFGQSMFAASQQRPSQHSLINQEHPHLQNTPQMRQRKQVVLAHVHQKDQAHSSSLQQQHQQQLRILHALQQPGLPDDLRHEYLSLLHQLRISDPLRGNPHEEIQQLNDVSGRRKQQPLQKQTEQHEPKNSITFHNLPDDSVIYTVPMTPQSPISTKDPDYIYVPTAEGLFPVPYDNYTKWMGANNVNKGSRVETNENGQFVPRANDSRPLGIQDHASRNHPTPMSSKEYQGLSQDRLNAQIASLEAPPRHPYMPIKSDDGVEACELEGARAAGNRLSQGSEPRTTALPQPHSPLADSTNYLSPISDLREQYADPSQDRYQFENGIPGLIQLPPEAFVLSEDQRVIPWNQNIGKSTLDKASAGEAPLSSKDTNANISHKGANTYTVASSDYANRVSQSKMSLASPNFTHQPPRNAEAQRQGQRLEQPSHNPRIEDTREGKQQHPTHPSPRQNIQRDQDEMRQQKNQNQGFQQQHHLDGSQSIGMNSEGQIFPENSFANKEPFQPSRNVDVDLDKNHELSESDSGTGSDGKVPTTNCSENINEMSNVKATPKADILSPQHSDRLVGKTLTDPSELEDTDRWNHDNDENIRTNKNSDDKNRQDNSGSKPKRRPILGLAVPKHPDILENVAESFL
ncbi:metabotropic glutamate receptor 5 [Plakobranchus ocellatus]|uniref:Metabotropic glutamate receptor 5 n=1 Tax=Plakobranchus ocellatus TaxID=259542 RepID=A0AAV4C695_9GAST|nr:metabotropic glutamate receptor 5 [Plakobranchus ocellatus]